MKFRTALLRMVLPSVHARIVIYWSLLLLAFLLFRKAPEPVTYTLVSPKVETPIVVAFDEPEVVKPPSQKKRIVTSKSKKSHKKSSTTLATVDINSANQSTLESLKGIGTVLAKRIVQYRDDHGLFSSVDELVNVKGIGPKSVEKLKNQARVSR